MKGGDGGWGKVHFETLGVFVEEQKLAKHDQNEMTNTHSPLVTAFKNAPKWHISKFKSESRPIYAWEKRISGLKQAKIKKSVANSNLNGP